MTRSRAWRDRLRYPSGPAQHAGAGAVSRRILALAHPDARAGARQLHRLRLPAECADQLSAPTGSRRRATPEPIWIYCARRRWMRSARATRSATSCMARRRSSARTCPPRCAARSTTGSPPSGCRKTTAPARVHRGADAQPGARREGDRAHGRRSALRAGAGVGDGRTAARPPHPLADLSRSRTARPADRHPCGFQLSPPADQSRLAVILPGRLRFLVNRIRRRAEQPDHRGRVRRVPAPEGRADGIRRDLAARLDVARRQDLARRARRGAMAGEIARRPTRASTCA